MVGYNWGMARLSIFLLGSPQFEINGEPIAIPRRKATALLAYLAITGEPQRRETLANFFWPDWDQPRAFAYLRNTLWEINRTLGEGWLLADRESIGINPQAEITLDLQNFQTLLAQVIPHVHPTDDGCRECAQKLEAAAGLYRGDFMAGFGLPDSPAFDDWQFFQAEEARQTLVNGLVRLIHMQIATENFPAALNYARRWSALDPLNEAAHRELIQIHAWMGQRNAALRQYQECQRILKEELGVEPESITTELFENIQSGQLQREQALALSPEMFTRRVPLEPIEPILADPECCEPVNNLPIPSTPFVGRQTELTTIAELLADPDCRLITLLGPGGIGKTRLAIQAAADQKDNFRHGVCFVSLASLRSGQPILPAITEALELPITSREVPATEQLVDFLRPRQLLLVLDNFEYLISEAPLVSEIIQKAPQIKTLVTSRVRLNLQGEWVTEIPGLSFPTPPDLESIPRDNGFVSKYCAVEFFVNAAQRTRTNFAITAPDYPAVARITQLVGGMPLGLELAASWVNVLNPQEIAAEIEQSLDFLESSLQDIPERQRSIRAVFDYSWKLMSDRERQIFPKLSVFRGGFTHQAAKKVLGVSPQDLMGLVNKSLVQHAGEGRFDLHPLLRQYASDILADLEVCKAVHDAHCAYFSAALHDLGESMTDRRQQQALSVLDADIDNAWAAWEWAVEHRQVERIDQAIYGLMTFLHRQFRFEEGLAACKSAREMLAAPQNSLEQRVDGHIAIWQALFEMRLGNKEVARNYFFQSWDLIEQANEAGEETRYERAFLRSMKAYLTFENGDLEFTRILLEESLALYKEIDHKYGVSEVLFDLAWLSSQQGKLEVVDQYHQSSLEIKRQIGDQYGLANELYYMAVEEAFQLGNIERAKEFFWESSDLFQDLGDPISNARSLRIMDDLDIINGWFEVALVVRQKMMKLYQNIGDVAGIGAQHTQLGEAYYHLGDYENAERQSRRSLEVLADKDYPFEQSFSRWQLGMTLLVRNRAEEARQLFLDCISACAESGRQDGLGGAYAGLARADFALGDYDQAWENARMAIKLLGEFRHFFWMFYALATAALLLAYQGDHERAIEIYSLISRFDFVANSKWFEDVFGQQITTLSAALPQEKRQAAQEKAQTLEVWQTAEDLLNSLGS